MVVKIIKYLFLFLGLFISLIAYSQCGIQDTIISIPDDENPLELKINVSGVINNDLSDPNQGVCAVYLNYEHQQRMDLTIDLISPAGQHVTLVGPRDPFNKPLTGSIQWDISFVRCADIASPDPGKSDVFDNSNSTWGLGALYNGVYYPNSGCLEDFDTGPVNGWWTLKVWDHDKIYKGTFYGFTIVFCDGSTYECSLCDANAGSFSSLNDVVCIEDPSPYIDIIPQYIDTIKPDTSFYGYTYILHQNNTLIEFNENPDFSVLTQGTYQLCGLSYLKEDSARIFNLVQNLQINDFIDSIEVVGSPYCADITDDCIDILVKPVGFLIDIDTTICSSDTLFIAGHNLFTPGDYYFDSSLNKCDSAVVVHLQVEDVNAGIIASNTILDCLGADTLKLTGTGFRAGIGMNFSWNDNLISTNGDTTSVFIGQPGNYRFVLSLGNCTDTAEISISSSLDFPDLLFDLQDIDCVHDSASLTVFSSNTSIDSAVWINEQGKYFRGTQIYTSDTGNYQVSVYAPGGCRAFDVVRVKNDTVNPDFYINATDITCDKDTAFLSIITSDSLQSILWSDLGQATRKDTFTLNSGKYYATVTAPNGCESQDSIMVNELKNTIDYVIYSDTISCFNDKAILGATPENGQFNSVFWINPLQDTFYNIEIETDIAGLYYFYFEDENGCDGEDSIQIIKDIDPPQLTISIPVLSISCGIDSVRLSFNSGSLIDSIYWTGPGGFFSNDFSPYAHFAGEYTVTIIGENGCSSSGVITVIPDNTVPDIEIISDTINCLKDSVSLSVNYTGNYQIQWEDPNGNIFAGNSINSNLDGYFKLTVTDLDKNCSNEFFAFVPVDTIHPQLQIFKDSDIDCLHKEVNVYINSDIPLKQIEWTGNGFSGSTDSILVDQSGWYKVNVLSRGSCESSDSIEVIETDSFNIRPDTLYLNCLNKGKVQLTLENVADSFEFHWVGLNLDTIGYSPIVSEEGKYNVVVSNGECTDSTFILVLEDMEPPLLEVEFDPVIGCNPTYSVLKASLDTTNIDTFYWLGPGFFSTDLIDTAYIEGQYTFRALGKNGCESLYFFNIVLSNDYTRVEAIGDTVNCVTGIHDLIISANILGQYDSLIWTGPNGFVSSNIDNIVTQTGMYYLEVVNSEGCISMDSTLVIYDISPPNYETTDPQKITCYNDSVLISVNPDTSTYSFSWTGPYGFESKSQNIYVDRGGEYFLTVTNENGCFSNDSVFVDIDKLKPYIFASAGDLNCADFVSEIEINSNIDNYSYVVRGPDNYFISDTMPRVNIPGVYYIELTDLDNGCTSFDSIIIKEDLEHPDLIVDDYYLNCDNSYIEMRARSSFPNITFYWDGPDTIYVQGDVCTTNTPGTYIVSAKGPNECITQDTITVYDIPVAPVFDAFAENINCLNDSAKLLAVGVEDDYSFEWTGPGGFYSNDKTPVVAAQGDYFLHVVGQNKCDSIAQVNVAVDTIRPQINILYTDSIICEKQLGTLLAEIENKNDTVYIFNWETSDGNIINGVHSSLLQFEGAGIYKVKVTGVENGCFSKDSFLVYDSEYSLDSAIIKINSPTCFGYSDGSFSIDSIVGGIGPYVFSIDNYWFSNSNEFNSKTAGAYDVYIKDANGCRMDTTIIIPNGSDVQLQLIADKTIIFPGEKVILKGLVLADNDIEKIEWKPEGYFTFMDTLNQEIFLDKSTDISLKVYDINNCSDEDELRIYVKNNPEIYIPDIFTPDYDNINDYFFVKTGKGIKSIKKFIIYDRWGEKVFEKSDMTLNVPIEGWDGKIKNKEAMEGVYVYLIEVELENGNLIRYAGDITLIR